MRLLCANHRINALIKGKKEKEMNYAQEDENPSGQTNI